MKKLSVFLLVFVVLVTFSYAEQLKVTPEHPFYLNGEWVEASELEVGDKLKTIDGKTAVIKDIRKVKEPVTVYNLEASSPHNYFADGVLVHNKAMLNRNYYVPHKGNNPVRIRVKYKTKKGRGPQIGKKLFSGTSQESQDKIQFMKEVHTHPPPGKSVLDPDIAIKDNLDIGRDIDGYLRRNDVLFRHIDLKDVCSGEIYEAEIIMSGQKFNLRLRVLPKKQHPPDLPFGLEHIHPSG